VADLERDPELKRLLAEEEEIERRLQQQHTAEPRGEEEEVEDVDDVVDFLCARFDVEAIDEDRREYVAGTVRACEDPSTRMTTSEILG
jgi:hypothetical protein